MCISSRISVINKYLAHIKNTLYLYLISIYNYLNTYIHANYTHHLLLLMEAQPNQGLTSCQEALLQQFHCEPSMGRAGARRGMGDPWLRSMGEASCSG